jgi:hypothetical protein
MEGIKTRIKTGKETTGDRIKDFVIYANGRVNKDIEAAYKRLDEMLKNKANKQILVVNEVTEVKDLLEKHYLCCPGDEGEEKGFMPPFKDIAKTETLRLGVLLEDCLSFDLETQKFAFPVGKHAVQFDKNHNKWKIVAENISLHAHEIILLDEKLYQEGKKHAIYSDLHGNSRSERLFVYVDEEVEKYFSEPRIDPEKCFSKLKFQKMNLSYIDALKLLNLEVPKKFLDAHDQERIDAKKRALDDIEHVLAEKPEPAYWNAACDHMRAVLDHAISLGMHTDESTMPGKQKGTTINVKEYITGLCKTYGVAVPR